jgi:molecular chaperone DnaK
VRPDGGLSESDIERMIKDAEASKKTDGLKREIVEIKNKADGLIYSTEDSLKEHKDSLDTELVMKIEDGIKRMNDAIQGPDNKDELKEAHDELEKLAMEIGKAMY